MAINKKKRKGFVVITVVLTLLMMIAFLAFVVDFGMIVSTRNTIKNNLELAGLGACTNDLDVGYLRSSGMYRLKVTDENGTTVNPFDSTTFPYKSTNPAEYDVCNFFSHSSKGLKGMMDTQNSTLTIWTYPQGSDYPNGWGPGAQGMNSNKKKNTLMSIDPIAPGGHYAMVFMEFHTKIFPAFMPAIGIGKQGIPITIKVKTETKPQTNIDY